MNSTQPGMFLHFRFFVCDKFQPDNFGLFVLYARAMQFHSVEKRAMKSRMLIFNGRQEAPIINSLLRV